MYVLALLVAIVINVLIASIGVIGVLMVFFAALFALSASRKFVFLVWLVLLSFGGVLVSVSLNSEVDKFQFDLLRGVDYLFLSMSTFIILILKFFRRDISIVDRSLIYYLLILTLYLVVGVANVGVSGAVTYFRYFTYPIFLYWILRSVEYDSSILLGIYVSYVLLLFLVLLEYLFPLESYDLINLYDYLSLKYDYYLPSLSYYLQGRDVEVISYEGFRVVGYRATGPTLHPISGAYFISLMSVFLYSVRKNYIYLVIGGFVAFLLLSKGALLLIGFILFSIIARNILPVRGFGIFMLFYFLLMLVLVAVGLLTNNPHHWSLMSSLNSLLSNPLGGGIGFGGTISTGTNFSTELGESSGDSSLALFCNMMGFFGLVVYLWGFWFSYRMSLSPLNNITQRLAYFVVFLLLCNGVSQEEALNPYSVAPVLFMLVFGSYHKFALRKEKEN